MVKDKFNLPCRQCPNAHNGINGRYCNVFNKYVEYDKSPICITKQQQP